MPRKPQPWFRFYVEAFSDRKLRRLSPSQRWLWVAILGAARESHEPGKLLIAEGMPMTHKELAQYADVPLREVVKTLTAMQNMGMIRGDDPITVVNWDQRQFQSDDVTARTEAFRERSKERSNDVPTNNHENVRSNVPRVRATETETETEVKTSSPEKPAPPPDRVDVQAICGQLAEHIRSNGGKANITQKWKNEARLLLDRDKRPIPEVKQVIDWCQADSFWKANILSMPTFREKYDQLRLKMRNGSEPPRIHSDGRPEGW